MSKAKQASALDELREIAATTKRGTGCSVCKCKPETRAKLEELLTANVESQVTTWNAIVKHVRERCNDPAFPLTNQTVQRHMERCRGITL